MYDITSILVFDDGTQTLEDLRTEIPSSLSDTHWTVGQGDTLLSISFATYRNHDNWDLIAKRNNIIDPYDLTIGDILTIPAK